MNKSIVVGGGIIVLVVAGLILWMYQGDSVTPGTQATTTPVGTDVVPNPPVASSDETAASGVPVIVTDARGVPTDTTAVVTGTVNPRGALTSYWYEYGLTSALGKSTAHQTIGSGYSAIPSPGYITGLTKNTTYYFRLVASNENGEVAGAQRQIQTTAGTPVPVGSAPTAKTLAATSVTANTAGVRGEVLPNKVATQYWFEYGTTRDFGAISSIAAAGSGSVSAPVSVTIANLSPATTYYYRLNAQNQFGTVNGATLSFKTSGQPLTVAPVVTTQVASPVATTTATLRGTVNPSGTQTTYWFEYATKADFSGSVPVSAKKSAGASARTISVTASVSGLTRSTTYYVRIVAQSSAGTTRGESTTFQTL